jgi:hypothetical protein
VVSHATLRATNSSNLGASAISFVPLAKGIAISSSVYDIRCSYMRGRAVVTNTAPTSAYRNAGRPEVIFVLERMIDIACRRHGFDRFEIRRRKLVPPEAMPRRAVVIVLRRQFIGARGAFLEGLGSVPLQHQVGGSPDVDLGYHAGKLYGCDLQIFNTKDCIAFNHSCLGMAGWWRCVKVAALR